MTSTSTVEQDMQSWRATGRDARIALLERSVRAAVPLRKTFVQALPGKECRHGPLKAFVTGRDLRGLKAYLLTVAACSDGSKGWSTTHDSAVWARLMDIDPIHPRRRPPRARGHGVPSSGCRSAI